MFFLLCCDPYDMSANLSQKLYVYYEGESNKNIKYFLNTIYCTEVVQSSITFQHNLPHAQCKSSSAYKVHKFL